MGCVNSRCDIEADGRRFTILKEIAQGGFSVVFLARDIDADEKVVVKKIDCHSEDEVARTRREIKVHQKFRDEKNIIEILTATETAFSDGTTRFHLVFPFRSKGTLQAELERRAPTKEYIPLPTVVDYFEQICNGVRALHKSNPLLIHRDLKPANVLFTNDGRLEITDFGSCIQGPIDVKDGKHSRQLVDDAGEHCSMTYRAPELFHCETGAVLSTAIDIWSLGCVLYAICFFKSPYDEAYEKGDSVPLATMSGRFKVPEDSPFPNSLIDVIKRLLTVEVDDRPDIDEALSLINSIIVK
uniref:non-specific serine/threonine protein kinase n=1 Tax=Panagrellus redivivus TaxID=6233 RepID=A0A7E4ZZA7_PANRE